MLDGFLGELMAGKLGYETSEMSYYLSISIYQVSGATFNKYQEVHANTLI